MKKQRFQTVEDYFTPENKKATLIRGIPATFNTEIPVEELCFIIRQGMPIVFQDKYEESGNYHIVLWDKLTENFASRHMRTFHEI